MIYHFTVHPTTDPDVSCDLLEPILYTVKMLSSPEIHALLHASDQISVTFRFHPTTQALVGGTLTFPPEYPSDLIQATVNALKNGATTAGIKTEWSHG